MFHLFVVNCSEKIHRHAKMTFISHRVILLTSHSHHTISSLLSLKSSSLVPQILKECRTQIPLPKTWNNDHNPLPSVLWTTSHLYSSGDGGTGGNTTEYSLFGCESSGHGHGVVAGDLDNFVDEGCVSISWNESRPNALGNEKCKAGKTFISNSI